MTTGERYEAEIARLLGAEPGLSTHDLVHRIALYAWEEAAAMRALGRLVDSDRVRYVGGWSLYLVA